MYLDCPIRDVRRFLEAVTRRVSAADVVLVVETAAAEDELPTLPPEPALALIERVPEDVRHLGLARAGMALLMVHGPPDEGNVEILAPELLPVLQDLVEAGVVDGADPAEAAELGELERSLEGVPATVRRTRWGLSVVPRNPRSAGFLLQPRGAPGEWGLLVPGAFLAVHLEPGEASGLVQAMREGRITQGRERSKSAAWIEWTRIELPERFLRQERGGGCLGFLRRGGEVVTWEPYG